MTIQETFVKKYLPFAKAVEKQSGLPALFTLAQSALETGWGKSVVGNMMFGVKDTDGINGNEQLITTTEYHNTPRVKYPVIFTIVEVVKGKRWKYKVKDWFRKYPTPFESFRDHSDFLHRNKRYKEALTYKLLPYTLAKEVCKAGYATSPDYYTNILSIMRTVEKYIKV